jgi:hypothetical protein
MFTFSLPRDCCSIDSLLGFNFFVVFDRWLELLNDHKQLTEELHTALSQGFSQPRPDERHQEPSSFQPLLGFSWIDAIHPDSPAYQAGLRRGDVLVRLGSVTHVSQLPAYIDQHVDVCKPTFPSILFFAPFPVEILWLLIKFSFH